MTARDVWRWTDERGVQRLVGTDELRAALASSILPPATLVWREGMQEWAPASTMPELASAAFAAASTPPPEKAEKPGPESDGFDGRGTLKEHARRATLIGLPPADAATPVEGKGPVEVPAARAHGDRPGVTQVPPFGAPAPDRDAAPRVPPAPRVPAHDRAAFDAPRRPLPAAGPSSTADPSRPKRKITTTEIDGLWASTTHSDEDDTIPRRARPSELAAAAAATATASAALRDARARPNYGGQPPSRPTVGRPAAPAADPAEREARPGPAAQSPKADPEPAAAMPAVPAKRKPPPLPSASSRLEARDDVAAKDAAATPPRPPPKPQRSSTPVPEAGSAPKPPAAKTPPPLPARAVASVAVPIKPAMPAVRLKPPSPPSPQARQVLASIEDLPAGATSTPFTMGSRGTPAHAVTLTGVSAPVVPGHAPSGAAHDAGSAPKAASPPPLPAAPSHAPAVAEPADAAPRADTTKVTKTLVSSRDSVESIPGLVEAIAASGGPAESAASDAGSAPRRRLDGGSASRPHTAPADPTPPEARTEAAPPTAAEEDEPDEATKSGTFAANGAAPGGPKPRAGQPASAHPAPAPASNGAGHDGAAARSDARAVPPEAMGPLPPPRLPQPSHPPRALQSSRPPPSEPVLAPVTQPLPGPWGPESQSAAPPLAPVSTAPPSSAPASEPASELDAARRPGLDEHVSVPLSSLLGAGGLLIGMVVAAFFVGRASSISGARLTAHPSLAAVPAVARAALPAPPKPCWMVKQPAMWAPHASRSIPFDAVATTKGGALAIGYARDPREAMGIEVDLATGEVKSRLEDKAKEEIERVVPTPAADFHVVRTGDAGPLKSPLHVPAATPFAVGLAAEAIALAAPPDGSPAPLWPLAGDEALGAATVHAAGERGFALIFRRGGAIWGGFIGADRKAVGDLVKVAGSGGAVGKPSGGWNGREVAVIFADRPDKDGRYEIRIGHAPPGAMPAATAVLPLPRGGPGGDAFAPDIAGLADGRWLLMWTEGAAGSRAVRAQTLGPDFRPLGDPIALSPPAGNFGQGVIGVAGDHAATVFLSKGASSYELWGAVLQCGG